MCHNLLLWAWNMWESICARHNVSQWRRYFGHTVIDTCLLSDIDTWYVKPFLESAIQLFVILSQFLLRIWIFYANGFLCLWYPFSLSLLLLQVCPLPLKLGRKKTESHISLSLYQCNGNEKYSGGLNQSVKALSTSTKIEDTFILMTSWIPKSIESWPFSYHIVRHFKNP